LQTQLETKDLAIGLFGASTGAAAALKAAAAKKKEIKAVVSRGGRPDLAMDLLPHVIAPTLLIVGGDDFGVIKLNQEAYTQLTCVKKLEIIPHATHLFEEPGCLEEVARLATEWFTRHLP
jgi:putative phosphoribosyl transferase